MIGPIKRHVGHVLEKEVLVTYGELERIHIE